MRVTVIELLASQILGFTTDWTFCRSVEDFMAKANNLVSLNPRLKPGVNKQVSSALAMNYRFILNYTICKLTSFVRIKAQSLVGTNIGISFYLYFHELQ